MESSDSLPAALSELTAEPIRRAQLLGVLAVAEAMTGDRNRAIALMLREPLRAFNGRTAVDLILQGRAPDVLAYLDSLSAGAAG